MTVKTVIFNIYFPERMPLKATIKSREGLKKPHSVYFHKPKEKLKGKEYVLLFGLMFLKFQKVWLRGNRI